MPSVLSGSLTIGDLGRGAELECKQFNSKFQLLRRLPKLALSAKR